MKKSVLTLLFIAGALLTGMAQITQSDKKNKPEEKINFQCRTLIVSDDGNMTSYHDDVAIKTEKLQIEADSATFDRKKNLLVTYSTRSLTFSGAVTTRKNISGICRYYLGTNELTVE